MATTQSRMNPETINRGPVNREPSPTDLREAELRSMEDRMNHAGSGELKRDIEVTRRMMDETLFELEQRLRPKNLLDDAVGFFAGSRDASDVAERTTTSDTVLDVGARLLGSLRANPLGSALLAAGIATVAFETYRRNRQADRQYVLDDYGVPQGVTAAEADEIYGSDDAVQTPDHPGTETPSHHPNMAASDDEGSHGEFEHHAETIYPSENGSRFTG